MTSNRDTALVLEVNLPPYDAHMGQPFPVEVELTNQSTGKLRVNKRMAPGYRGHLSRELFAELWEAGTDRSANVHELDYDRDFATLDDFVYLEPGAGLRAQFDLLEWYAPESPGAYKLVVYYQADEQLANAPSDTFQGIAASEPVSISILAGISDTRQENQS